jgi:hypothetical protein
MLTTITILQNAFLRAQLISMRMAKKSENDPIVSFRSGRRQTCFGYRVTRLVEFSHMYWAVALFRKFFITYTLQILGLLFPRYKLCMIFFQQLGWAAFLGDFFTNSSGRPVRIQPKHA